MAKPRTGQGATEGLWAQDRKRQQLTDWNTLFVEKNVKQNVRDLLDGIDHGLRLVVLAEENLGEDDYDDYKLVVNSLETMLRNLAHRVETSGIFDAAFLDETHPRFKNAVAAVRTSFSVDRDLETITRDGHASPPPLQ